MEAETISQVKDPIKLDETPLQSFNEVAKPRSMEVELIKGGSLKSLKSPLSTSCARHGYDNDFLPSELLANLTNQFETIEDLGPQGKAQLKRGKAFPKVYPKRPPDNVWNHSKTREKFKHLTDQPPCTCGAGRDISFLYDAVSSKKSSVGSPSKSLIQPERETKEEHKEVEKRGTQIQEKYGTEQHFTGDVPKPVKMSGSMLQETLLPSEFHIIKNPGVLGLEVHDDKFTTTLDNHGKHLTLFPSMKPSGRQEAILLKKTMKELLSRVAVYDLKVDADQPTQIHALLDLVKQEQNIYNVIFNEVIRQVTVECVERGEVLADLRKKYAALLDKIPRHVKSLHEEVLAQRALDRRLTEELTRFRTSITLLTRELHAVQEHDREVTKKAAEMQEELNEALRESEKNANLLAEYHELYELQRKRLEYQISKLIEERDLWAGASYTLSIKVARRNNLKTAKRLHLHEKAWYKLASHFAIVLSDSDSTHLQQLTSNIQQWQTFAEKLHGKLLAHEKETCRRLTSMQSQIRSWGKQFSGIVSSDGQVVKLPEQSKIAKLCEDIKNWEEVFNSEVERFSGDILLSCEDSLINMSTVVDNWNEIALKIFRNHPNAQSGENRAEHQLMMSLNVEIDKLHTNFKARMTGENGLAKGMVHFINTIDSLINKLTGYSLGSEIILDPEWIRIADFLQNEWDELLSEIIEVLNREIRSDDIVGMSAEGNHIQNAQLLGKAIQKWLAQMSYAIENTDASMLDQVSNNHSNMVRWMVTILLRLAPDLDADPLHGYGDIQEAGMSTAIIEESMTAEIQEKAKLLFRCLRRLTTNLHNCCKGIVHDDHQESNGDGDGDGDKKIVGIEARDLHKIKAECNGWIRTAILLVEELSGDTFNESENEDERDSSYTMKTIATESYMKSEDSGHSKESVKERPVSASVESSKTTKEPQKVENDAVDSLTEVKGPSNTVEAQDATDSIQVHVVGRDDNVELKVLDTTSISEDATLGRSSGLLKADESSLEALITIEKLQEQLVETEERAQKTEERAIAAETSLKEALERIRALERTVRRASQDSIMQRPHSEIVSSPDIDNGEASTPTTH